MRSPRTIGRLVSLVAVALTVMIVGALVPLWFGAARALEAGIRTWADAPRDGVVIELGRVTVSGFPFSLDATLSSFAIASSDLGLRWYAEHVRVARSLGDDAVTFEVVGPQQVTLASGTAVDLDADRFDGTLRRGAGAPSSLVVQAAGVRARLFGAPLASLQRMSLHVAAPDAAGAIPSGTKAALRIDGVTLPAQRRGPFGDTILELVANLALEGGIDSLALARSLPAWVQGGGRLYVSDSSVRWGTLDAGRIGGTLRLDQAARLTGRLDITFRDPVQTFDALAAADWVDAKTRAELVNGIAYYPNRVLVKPYRVTFLGGGAVLDDIGQDTTAPIPLWRVPAVVSRRSAPSEAR
jgi:hypothetical protein